MRGRAIVVGGVLAAALLGSFGALAQQPIEPLRPEAQQEIEILRPEGKQAVEDVELTGEQEVGVPEKAGPGRRAASAAGKVVLGVLAAGIAVGAMMASLLLL